MEEHSDKIENLHKAALALELPKVLHSISTRAVTSMASQNLLKLEFLDDIESIQQALARVTDLRNLLDSGEDLNLEYFEDLGSVFEVLRVEGATVAIEKLIGLGKLARNGRIVLGFLRSQREKCPHLWEIAHNLQPVQELENAIQKSIDPATFEVLDSASPELKKIRREINAAQQRVRQKLENILKSSSAKDMLRDQLISMREGRHVLMVKDEYRRKIKGIVHDQSATGQTFFIEPVEIVELNNSVRQFEANERAEIERIIAQICEIVRVHLDALRVNYDCLILLDEIRASALYSRDFLCNACRMSESGEIKLEFARHPLLLEKMKKQDAVIPLSLALGRSFKTLVITGPNSGGKTVAMKTVGLAVLMTRLGLHIPASADSEIGIIGRMFVDIGDEQSIEDDLSTFTSHMLRLRTMLADAQKSDLILIDEMGSGTDPDEGTALALASLLALTKRGVLSIVTTHHGALKEFAHDTADVENGSMVFDIDTLQPTYRFRLGVPGSSYAFEIATRVGLKPDVIDQARALVGSEKGRVEKLIADLENKLHAQETLLHKNQLDETRLQGMMKLYAERADELKKNKRTLQAKAIAESEELLQQTNATIESTIRLIKENQASSEAIREAKKQLNEQRSVLAIKKAGLQKEKTGKQAKHIKIDEISPGQTALWKSQQIVVSILEKADSENRVVIQAGSMRLKVAVTELEFSKKKQKKQRVTAHYQNPKPVMQELDLRGKRADEAISEADRFISEAIVQAWDEVRLVHGKGTGALRKALAEFLQSHPNVRDFGPAALGQGDVGVTCVRFQ
ncbi:MAG: endonuclease MutS2 [Calditrichaeota bacterium]|nr:MAG: endonuclease MutS2 [Calditrichota bacterium]